MQFTTPIDITPSSVGIGHNEPLLLLGSCFADSIGGKLTADKFDCLVNPFGTLYNPASIAAQLLRCMSEQEYEVPRRVPAAEDGDGTSMIARTADGTVFSWMHHGCFSTSSPEALVDQINETMHLVATRLRTARWLIVTFGSAYVYRLKSNGLCVANCHRQPDRLFIRERLAAIDIVDMWQTVLQLLHSMNPHLHVIFTVSPIRHKRDGLHANQLSKAELLLATAHLTEHPAFADFVSYFPSYEIMMDELRDYRFYGDDLVHPSTLATDYIYERFTTAFVSPDEQQLSAECRSLVTAVAHRPLHADSPAYQQFVRNTIQRINQFNQQHPAISWDEELELCNTLLKK